MLGSAVGYFLSVITVFAAVITFMTLLIGVFDNSTVEKLRHYPRPIIERTAPPNQEPHIRSSELRHPLVARGTNDTTAPKQLSASDKNTKNSRAASGAKADAENREPERNIRPERLAHLREPKGLTAALGLVGGLVIHAVDSVLTTLTPQLRPDAGADNQPVAPQQKPQPGSTLLS